jgi:trk system potassium uptake protein TrkA
VNVVVVGAGEVGSSIAANLAAAHDVTVIDRDPDRVENLTYSQDVLAIRGDGASLATLREANVADADIVIASTDDDETNLVICGTAKTVSGAFRIARVRRTQYLDTWTEAEGAFGVDFMVGTDLLTAESIVRVIGLPAAHDVDSFANDRVRMAQLAVTDRTPIVGETVQEADRYEQLTFAAVLRGEEVLSPTGETVIEAGDELVVIGSPESVQQFASALAPEQRTVGDVVIVGGSAVGALAARLLEERGFRPRLIERDADRARELAEELPRTTVMCHDGTDRDFLRREHVDEADVLVAALESDEKNLFAALLADRLGTARTVAVVEEMSYVDLFEQVGIDVAVNPREVTAEEITRFTHEQHTENVALIEGDRAEVLEIEIDADSSLAGRPIQESVASLPAGLVVGAITRDEEFITPRGETVIEPGDHVVIFAHRDAIAATDSL